MSESMALRAGLDRRAVGLRAPFNRDYGLARISQLTHYRASVDPPPLQSPSQQQAHDSIRGYVFQCWLTVDAWLRLRDDDRLYVECAEDFATFSKEKAEVAQAKATSAPISLRSPGVIEAINHLWAFQQHGFPGLIRFSFLTTAEIVAEKGDPFNGIAGLVLWRESASNGDETKAERIRNFLASDSSVVAKLEPGLLSFIKAAPAKEFLANLVAPLIWDTGHADESGVREAVEGRLAVMAEKEFAASPTHAGNMADTLFTEAISVAASRQKVGLTRGTLLGKLRAHLLPQAVSVLAARQQELLGGLFAAGLGIVPQWISSHAIPPIQPAADFSPRSEVVTDLQSRIGSSPFAVLTGSTGMGKTTLAQLIAARSGGAWLHFRAKDNFQRALRGVHECMALIDQQVSSLGLIIDDLPWENLDGAASTVMRGLAFVVRRQNARVVFTNQRPPTERELATAGMSDACVEPVPALSKMEIAEIASRLGCAARLSS